MMLRLLSPFRSQDNVVRNPVRKSRAPELCNDEWGNVVSFLDAESTCRLERTSQRFTTLANNQDHWQNLCSRSDSSFRTDAALPALLKTAVMKDSVPYKQLWFARRAAACREIADLAARVRDGKDRLARASALQATAGHAGGFNPAARVGDEPIVARVRQAGGDLRRLEQQLTTRTQELDNAGLALESVPARSKMSWLLRLFRT